MINFICNNDYHVLQALQYKYHVNTPIRIFNTNSVQYNDTIDVQFINVSIDAIKLPIKKYNYTTEEDILLLKTIYDLNEELHVFEDVEYLYVKGRDNLYLHDNGDNSYIINEYNTLGEADPFIVYKLYYRQPCNDPRQDSYTKNAPLEQLRKTFRHKGLDKTIPDNTILFVHNEPDSKYTEEEKQELYKELENLFIDIKKAGYTLWIKEHHKRTSGLDFSKYADNIISGLPLELIPNLDKYKYVVSLRNNYLHFNDKLQNSINALTQEAVTKCKKNWKYVYNRGIVKLRKQLNLLSI